MINLKKENLRSFLTFSYCNIGEPNTPPNETVNIPRGEDQVPASFSLENIGEALAFFSDCFSERNHFNEERKF